RVSTGRSGGPTSIPYDDERAGRRKRRGADAVEVEAGRQVARVEGQHEGLAGGGRGVAPLADALPGDVEDPQPHGLGTGQRQAEAGGAGGGVGDGAFEPEGGLGRVFDGGG